MCGASEPKHWSSSAEPVEPDRELSHGPHRDGLIGKFVLDNAGALQFEQAIRIASTWDGSSDTRPNQRRSALTPWSMSARSSTPTTTGAGTPRQRPHIELMVDTDTLSTSPLAWTTDHACDRHHHHRRDAVRLRDPSRASRRQRRAAYGRATRTVPAESVPRRRRPRWRLPLPGLRPQGRLERRPPHPLLAQHGPDRSRQPRTALQPPPPPRPPPRLHLKLLPNGDLDITYPDGTTRTSQPRGQPPRSP